MGLLRLRMTEHAPTQEPLLRPKVASLRSQIKTVEFLNCPQCGTAFTVENGAILTADRKLGCGFFKDAELGWVTAHQILAGVGCSFCTDSQNYEYIFACGHRACTRCKPPEQRPKCAKKCRGGDGPAGAGSDVLSFYVKYLDFSSGLRRRRKKTICGKCGLLNHKNHDFVQLITVELKGLRTEIGIEQKNLYEGLAGNITGLHDCTREAVNALLAVKDAAYAAIEQQTTLIDGHKVREEMRAAAKYFEEYCEDYIPLVRSLNDRLHETKEQLDKLLLPKTQE
ncbi:unnamed protein product, partial [Mesorhabditis spiculigera]